MTTPAPHPRLFLRNVELDAARRNAHAADVVIEDGRVVAVVAIGEGGDHRPLPEDIVIDGRGGALVHGLADHHTHLHALAAAMRSVDCGPPAVRTRADLAAALREAAATRAAAPNATRPSAPNGPGDGGWLRGRNYHESVAGELTRDVLDSIEPDRPVRVQHRSGALWIVNSPGLRLLGLDEARDDDAPADFPSGVECDDAGRPTGRLWRLDGWLRDRIPSTLPDLAEVGRLYASFGVTHLVDATPDLTEDTARHLADSVRSGALPQDVTLLGGPPHADLWRDFPPRIRYGPTKLLPPDHDPWPYDELVARIRRARADDEYRFSVAIHCVTRESLVLALAALGEVGPPRVGRDRIEHASVVPPELMDELARRRIHVVTQPGFIAERGDAYATDVDAIDIPHLYPYASLLRAGVSVGLSSDAPYGDPDPWHIIRAARDRRTPSGLVLGPDERVPARTAFNGFAGNTGRPSSRPPLAPATRNLANLVLLHTPLEAALTDPHHNAVRLTISAGHVVHDTT